MLGSRTIKTLTALLISMTIGAFVLMLLETAPVRPPAQALAAVTPFGAVGELIHQTQVPLQAIKWRHVVIHGSQAGEASLPDRCHFKVFSDGEVVATTLWQRQLSGTHALVSGRDFNADSIGVCLMGDFSSQPPAPQQMDGLLELVQSLQSALHIPSDRVYLQSELDARLASPGTAFPALAFNARLRR